MSLLLLILLFAVPLVSSWTCPEWGPRDICRCSYRKVSCFGNASTFSTSNLTRDLEMLGGVDSSSWQLTLADMPLARIPAVANTASTLIIKRSNIFGMKKPVRMEWPNLFDVEFEEMLSMHSPWSFLEGAKGLSHFTVKGSSMIPTIGEEFRKMVPPSVTFLTLERTGTTTIEPGSMAHLKILMKIELAFMPIRVLHRSVLPEKLPWLTHMFLLYNLLEKLEPAFFDGMPNLGYVLMHGNRFTTLESSWFTPTPNTLKLFMMDENPLRCGCNLSWIKQDLEVKNSSTFRFLSCYNLEENAQSIRDINEQNC